MKQSHKILRRLMRHGDLLGVEEWYKGEDEIHEDF